MTPRKQAEERLSLLAEVSELTRRIEEPDELMAAVANSVGGHLQVRRCLFNEIDLQNDLEIVHGDYHDGLPSVEGVHKLSEYSNVTTAEIASGKTIVNYNSKTDPRTASDYERSYAPNRERAYVAVPLMRDDRWVASLWVSDDMPRQWEFGGCCPDQIGCRAHMDCHRKAAHQQRPARFRGTPACHIQHDRGRLCHNGAGYKLHRRQ